MFSRFIAKLFGRVNAELDACESEGAELTRALSELRLTLVTQRERVERVTLQINETFGALDSVDEHAPPALDWAPVYERVEVQTRNGRVVAKRARKSK